MQNYSIEEEEDKENLYEIGTDNDSDIPIMQKTPKENAKAMARLLDMRKANPLPPSRSLVEEAARRSHGPIAQQQPEAPADVDLSRFDDRLKQTIK